jgi:Tol biopolymer transport system component
VRCGAVTAVLTAAALTICAAQAQAASTHLVYQCGKNICRMDQNGGHRSKVTKDGTKHNYSAPDMSKDGKTVSFVQDGNVAVTDATGANKRIIKRHIGLSVQFPRLNANGRLVLWTELVYGFTYNAQYLYTSDTKGKHVVESAQRDYLAAWAAHDDVFRDSPGKRTIICVTSRASDACKREVAHAPAGYPFHEFLNRPEVSPNGHYLAATVAAQYGAQPTYLALYDTKSATLVRNLTNGPADDDPTWSPDGKWLAFNRGGDVYRVSAKGGTTKKLVAKGGMAGWGK